MLHWLMFQNLSHLMCFATCRYIDPNGVFQFDHFITEVCETSDYHKRFLLDCVNFCVLEFIFVITSHLPAVPLLKLIQCQSFAIWSRLPDFGRALDFYQVIFLFYLNDSKIQACVVLNSFATSKALCELMLLHYMHFSSLALSIMKSTDIGIVSL